MINFWVSLWAAKLLLFCYKLKNDERDDRPGLLALKICDRFLEYVAKPQLVVLVTGTNGKTTVANLVSDLLIKNGKTVAYNDWGANYRAGQARCLLDAVNIFNRPNKDAAVIEADEKTTPYNIPQIKPNYIIVTNVSRDSIRRNAHPEYIFERINTAVSGTVNSKLILNADDPLSSFLGDNNPRVYYAIADQHTREIKNNVDDFPVCPECGQKPVYQFRHYRSFGQFSCPQCGFCSKQAGYYADNIDYYKSQMTVYHENSEQVYPLISDTIFNAYNVLSIVTLFNELGFPPEKIAADLKDMKVPESRESYDEAGGIKLYTYLAKGQNVSAASTVFEYLSSEPSQKEIVLLLNEVYGNLKATETVTWIYETDFEYLNNDNIKKIVMGGERYLDYKLRLLLAGIPEEKIVCIHDEYETAQYVDISDIDSIYVLHEADAVTKAKDVRKLIKNRILEGANVQ